MNWTFSACIFNTICGLEGCQFPLLHQLGYLAGELNIGIGLNNLYSRVNSLDFSIGERQEMLLI